MVLALVAKSLLVNKTRPIGLVFRWLAGDDARKQPEMRSLQQLEKEARDRRAQFNATLLDVQSRLTLPGLAKEALLHMDPHLTRLPPAFLAVKRHPILGRWRSRRRELAAQAGLTAGASQIQKWT